MSMKDTALIEAITEVHRIYVGEPNPNVSYCQATSRRGLLKTAEMNYISDHGCPSCGKPPFGLPSDAELFARSYNAKLAVEQQTQSGRSVIPPDWRTEQQPAPAPRIGPLA